MRGESTDEAVVIVYARNSSGATAGQSPTLAVGPEDVPEEEWPQFWWGCVFLFEVEKRLDTAASTLAHELVHALGLPHKCARWDLHTPRKKTCAMNYFNEGLLDDDGEKISVPPVGASTRSWRQPIGNALCAQHVRELRSLNLLLHEFKWRW